MPELRKETSHLGNHLPLWLVGMSLLWTVGRDATNAGVQRVLEQSSTRHTEDTRSRETKRQYTSYCQLTNQGGNHGIEC